MNKECCDITQLNEIKDKIEKMSRFHQIEILRILNKNKTVIINENKYGIHINLNDVDTCVLNELLLYIDYVNTQETYLNNAEQEKENYKNTFFVKGNKDIST